jgi:hypothetical protein
MPQDQDLQLLGAGIRASATEHPSERSYDEEQEKEHRGRVADSPSPADHGFGPQQGISQGAHLGRGAERRLLPASERLRGAAEAGLVQWSVSQLTVSNS